MSPTASSTRSSIPLSVVVVTRNEEERIEACLDSIFQVCEPAVPAFEVILIDSQSTDRTVERAAAYPISIYALTTEFVTPGAGRRAGTEVASGDRILFVDGDMVLSEEWLPRALDYMDSHDVAGVDGHLNESTTDTVHPVDSIRGVSLYDAATLRSVGGFDPYLNALEDIQVGYELTISGHELVRLPEVAAFHPSRSVVNEPFRRWRYGYSKGSGQAIRRSWPQPRLLAKNIMRIRYRLVILGWYLVGIFTIRHPVRMALWLLGVIGGGIYVVSKKGLDGAASFFMHNHLGLIGMVPGLSRPLPERESFGTDDFEQVASGPVIRHRTTPEKDD